MPSIYLSPSTQEFNPFVIGGNEEQYMNLITDAMIPILEANGIQFGRNTPDMTAGSSIRESNAGNYDLHLAIHSNASGPGQEGRNRGVVVFYHPNSTRGRRFAEIIASNFTGIYPNPELVRIVPTTSLGEVARTAAPSVLVEVAYHDNVEDATWIVNNIDLIGQALANSVVQYFQGSPQTGGGQQPQQPQGNTGVVTLQSGYLNIRQEPSINSPVIAMAPNGATLTIIGRNGDWYNVNYNGNIGYAAAQYIRIVW